jgi:hypothetical protein
MSLYVLISDKQMHIQNNTTIGAEQKYGIGEMKYVVLT